MSAIGPKRTSLVAPHMSALRGKADMTVCGSPLLRSLLGVKRTCLCALHMSAFDPKRTWAHLGPDLFSLIILRDTMPIQSLGISMRRREFLAVLGGGLVCPLNAHAQQRDGVRRIGVLMSVT